MKRIPNIFWFILSLVLVIGRAGAASSNKNWADISIKDNYGNYTNEHQLGSVPTAKANSQWEDYVNNPEKYKNQKTIWKLQIEFGGDNKLISSGPYKGRLGFIAVIPQPHIPARDDNPVLILYRPATLFFLRGIKQKYIYSQNAKGNIKETLIQKLPYQAQQKRDWNSQEGLYIVVRGLFVGNMNVNAPEAEMSFTLNSVPVTVLKEGKIPVIEAASIDIPVPESPFEYLEDDNR
jgi:hypothetical protein